MEITPCRLFANDVDHVPGRSHCCERPFAFLAGSSSLRNVSPGLAPVFLEVVVMRLSRDWWAVLVAALAVALVKLGVIAAVAW